MNEELRFSIIIYLEEINPVFYRDCLESITASTYKNYEVVVLDTLGIDPSGSTAREFFPEEGMLKYHRVRAGKSKGYGLNLAVNYSSGDILLFLDKCARLSTIALAEMQEAFENEAQLVYSDNDSIVGLDRMEPEFKPRKNVELIRHRNYIGDVFAILTSAFLELKGFRDILKYVPAYDLILRAFEQKLDIVHVPKLLYSKRITQTKKVEQSQRTRIFREQMVVVDAHLRRQGITARIIPSRRGDFLYVYYDTNGYRSKRKDYIVLKDENVKTSFRNTIPRLYSYIKQPDVGMVGVTFLKNPWVYDNCGYIFDENGIAYPVANGQNIFFEGLYFRCIIPQDVSMIDLGYCLIKKKLYNRLGGFDRMLTDRDMALDFCLKVQKAGYRVVIDPMLHAYRSKSIHESSAPSNERLKERWGETLQQKDKCYNINLPMGLMNYVLY